MADAPIINPNWLSHPADKEVAIAAFKRVRQIWQAPDMRPLLIGDEYFPGKKVQTDDEIWRNLQETFSTIFHPACTCKMGPDNDNMAVLDHHARVRGVSGLRVVDASSLPILPPGHPMSTICKSKDLPASMSRWYCGRLLIVFFLTDALAEKISYDMQHGH